jgi:hypothetical protein
LASFRDSCRQSLDEYSMISLARLGARTRRKTFPLRRGARSLRRPHVRRVETYLAFTVRNAAHTRAPHRRERAPRHAEHARPPYIRSTASKPAADCGES